MFKVLQHKAIYTLLLFIGIVIMLVVQINRRVAYPNIGYDYILQAITLKSYIQHNEIAIPHANPENLSDIKYERTGLWPQGYNLIALPFFKYYNFDPIKTYRAINIIAFLLLIIVQLAIIRLVYNTRRSIWLPYLFVFWAFCFFPYKAVGITDILSLTAFLFSIYLFIHLVFKDNSNIYLFAILIGLSAFATCFFRFAYYPLALVIPLSFLLYAIFIDKSKKRHALTCIGIAIACIFIQIIFQKIYFGNVDIASQVIKPNNTKFLHVENLKYFDAIFLNTLIDEDIIYRFFNATDWNNKAKFTLWYIIGPISLLVASIIGYVIFRTIRIYSNPRFLNLFKTKESFLVSILAISALANIFVMIVLALKYPSFALPGEIARTYVMFPRYFTLSIICFQFILIGILFSNNDLVYPKVLKQLTLGAFAISSIIGAGHWWYHEYKFKIYMPQDEYADAYQIKAFIESQNTPTKKIFVGTKTSSDNEFIENNFSGLVTLWSDAYIDFSELKDQIISSSHVMLIIPLANKGLSNSVGEFCRRYNAKPILHSTSLNKTIMYINYNNTSNHE